MQCSVENVVNEGDKKAAMASFLQLTLLFYFEEDVT